MSSQCSNEVAFRFHKEQLVTTDADKSFHDIRLNNKDPLYIQLNFKNAHQNEHFAAVLQENPFIPDTYFITKKDTINASQLLGHTLYQFKKQHLEEQINWALDNKDESFFIYLAGQISQLHHDYVNQPDSF